MSNSSVLKEKFVEHMRAETRSFAKASEKELGFLFREAQFLIIDIHYLSWKNQNKEF